MFLKRLEIYGFKSFGTKSILDFENGKIAGVVGPNGSGKSNVADAIRWVLGEQSTNLLRSKKGEDVVFIGSQKKARSSYAEVSLLLSGDQEVEVEIAGKKHKFNNIEITRKLYRSGEGEYLINRKKVRLLDLQTLLASLGFGQSSYTVIGQGMVDRLLFFNAAERRVLFDEAAGVKQYKIKRGQAIKRLETTEENLIRLKDIGQELGPRVQNLRRLVKKAEGRQETEKELLEAEQKYYGSITGELSDNISKLNLKKEGFAAKISYLESEKEKKFSDENKAPESLMVKQKNLEVKLSELQDQRDECLKEIAFIEGQIREQENFFFNLKNNQSTLAKEKERLTEELDKLQSEITLKIRLSSDLEEKISGLEKELSELQKNYSQSEQTQESETAKKLQLLEKEKTELEKEQYRLEEAEGRQEKEAKESTERKFALAKEVMTLKSELKDKEAEVQKEKQYEERLVTEIKNLERVTEKNLAEIRNIEEEILANRERINPGSIDIFRGEIKKLKEEHRKFSGHVENGSENLTEHLQSFNNQFTKILKLTHDFSVAIDPVMREKLEEKLTSVRSSYLASQKNLAEKHKEIESAKHRVALLTHQMDHIKEIISEKSKAGENLQLSSKSYSKEIKAIKNEIEKVSNLLNETTKQVELENTKKDKDRLAITKDIDLKRNWLYDCQVEKAENIGLISGLKNEIERLKSSLAETNLLLAKTKTEKTDHDLEKKLRENKDKLVDADKLIEKVRSELKETIEESTLISQRAIENERAVYEIEKREGLVRDQINEIELEKARFEAKREAIEEEMRLFQVKIGSNDIKLNQSEKDLLRARIENLRRKKDSIATLDPETIAEYEESEKRLSGLSEQLSDLEKAKDDLEKLIKELDRKISLQFSNTFKNIGERFQQYFALLFEGGKASLTLEIDEESGEAGIEISANPPGKKVQSLSMLSGGERTLTSLALVFAILSINPSPFCVLDEVDAALDEANTLRFIRILKDLDRKTQFIVITHNRETMRVANYLYGLTMNEEHISKLFSVKLTEAFEAVK